MSEQIAQLLFLPDEIGKFAADRHASMPLIGSSPVFHALKGTASLVSLAVSATSARYLHRLKRALPSPPVLAMAALVPFTDLNLLGPSLLKRC